MSGILDTVDQRTKLVGENRLELLLFRLEGEQIYAINVFKVQEVQQLPKLTSIPHSSPIIVGVTHCRGQTIPVIDLATAIDMPPISSMETANIIIAEYNMTIQAFLVGGVDRIVNMNWEQISAPPPGSGRDNFLTAITNVNDKIVEIIDVEKILSSLRTDSLDISENILRDQLFEQVRGRRVLLVDDSQVALRQASNAMVQMGFEVVSAENGAKGLQTLLNWVDEGYDFKNEFLLMVTDAEMPEMDGYRLVTECRSHPILKDLYIIMHTSLSGNFNEYMTEKVGCDAFSSKFQPDVMANLVLERIKLLNQID